MYVDRYTSGFYPGTQVMIKHQFISGHFEKQYAFFKYDDKKQETVLRVVHFIPRKVELVIGGS